MINFIIFNMNLQRPNIQPFSKRSIVTMMLMAAVVLQMKIAASQDLQERTITLRGKVICTKPFRGALENVAVFNTSKNSGTLTDKDGNLTLKMGQYDTIIFSTQQHKEYVYFLQKNETFGDKVLEVIMEPDTIWLDAVTVTGTRTLEEFKDEVLQLNITSDDKVSLALPVIDKYAKQFATGNGSLDLKGPLTYLTGKFSRDYMRRKRIEDQRIRHKS